MKGEGEGGVEVAAALGYRPELDAGLEVRFRPRSTESAVRRAHLPGTLVRLAGAH